MERRGLDYAFHPVSGKKGSPIFGFLGTGDRESRR
jgi:hypothetical protein